MIKIEAAILSQVTELWREVASYPLVELDTAMKLFLHTMVEILDVNSMVWVAAATNKNFNGVPTSELLGGWFGFDSIYDGKNTAMVSKERYALYMQLKEKNGLDRITEGVTSHAGKSRVHLRSDFLSDQEWSEYWVLKDYYKQIGTGDLMYSVTRLDQECESYLLVQSKSSSPYFSERERQILDIASSGIHHLHRKMMLLRGAILPCNHLLSPKEKEVLMLLLKAKREKEIAESLELSSSTISKHISSLYRKYQVAGKFELMNRFLE